ncbi:MAG: nucleotidyltransferase [Acidobacteriota bacterium]|nr:nucleotidyltransferase [Acidobacteriota bacterium]
MELLQNQLESVSRLQASLRNAGILSAVIGGIAVAVWGDPRATKDADLKVLLTRDQATQLLNALPKGYTIESSDPEGDLRQFGFLFTRDDTGVRIDLLLADLSFDQQVIERGREIQVPGGIKIIVCSPEDLIIYKCESRVRAQTQQRL